MKNESSASLLEVALPEAARSPDFDLRQVTTGEQLAQARARAGLSAEAVASRLNFSVAQVNAFDAERWEQLPDLAFVRAGLRSYGRLIDVDVTALVDHVGGFAQATVLQPTIAASDQTKVLHRAAGSRARSRVSFSLGSWPMMIGAVAGTVLLGTVVLLLAQTDSGSGSRSVQVVPIPGVESPNLPASTTPAVEKSVGANGRLKMTQVAALPVTIRASGMMMRTVANPDSPAPVKQAALTEKPVRVPEPIVEPVVAPRAGMTVFPVQMPDSEPVHVHFKKRSWIDISHKDGIKLLDGNKDGGQSFTLDGRPPMEVKIGNPDGVMIEFRGQVINLQSKINNKGIAQFTLN